MFVFIVHYLIIFPRKLNREENGEIVKEKEKRNVFVKNNKVTEHGCLVERHSVEKSVE